MNNTNQATEKVRASLKRRHARERRFRWYGLIAISLGLAFLALLFISIVGKGYSAFQQTYVQLEIDFAADEIDPKGERDAKVLSRADYQGLVKSALRELFPEAKKRREKRELYRLVSSGAGFQLREMVLADQSLIGSKQKIWLPADDNVDSVLKGHIDRNRPENERAVKDNQLAWIDQLLATNSDWKNVLILIFSITAIHANLN